jgi:hypothetical protein
MNTATAIKRWVTPVPEQKTEVRTYSRKNQETATNESLWKICQATSRAKGRESRFYAFFLLLAIMSSASAFATLLDMLNAGSLIYFVEHALR